MRILLTLPALILLVGCAGTAPATPAETTTAATVASTATPSPAVAPFSTVIPRTPTSTRTAVPRASKPMDLRTLYKTTPPTEQYGIATCLRHPCVEYFCVPYRPDEKSGVCSGTIDVLLDTFTSYLQGLWPRVLQVDNMACGDAVQWHLEKTGSGPNDYACFEGRNPLVDPALSVPTPQPTWWPTVTPEEIATRGADMSRRARECLGTQTALAATATPTPTATPTFGSDTLDADYTCYQG